MSKTLLLNASYEPLSVIPWQRAMCLFFMDKVEVIETYDLQINSSTAAFDMPSVVRLYSYVKRKYLGIKFSRKNIYARDSHLCQYCGKHFGEGELSFDHVVPRSGGGKTSWDNIVTACIYCNRKKGCRNIKEAGMTLLSRPERPKGFMPPVPYQKDYPPSWVPYLPQFHKISS